MEIDRELNDIAEVLRLLTIAFVENKTKCISESYRYVYRTVGEFGLSVNCIASENAFNDFYNRTGQDIRLYKRGQNVLDKSAKRFIVHQEYMYEHLIPASSFRNSLIDLYKANKLNNETVKQKILEQKMCWITKEENNKLNELKFSYKGRDTFEKAVQVYLKAGIKIKE